jgi:AcrR family transcriptional regulator
MSGPTLASKVGLDRLPGMDKPTPALKRPRRPQAERSADTRAKLIEAAISGLHRLGYAATTVTVVAEAAGVSRGAMTHQFPAKTDLMLAVVRAVFEKDGDQYRRSVGILSPVEWMRQLPAVMWEVISQPSGIAVMEIMLASRSDPELAEKLRIIQQRIDVEAHAWVVERHEDAGIIERPDGEAIHRVFVAAVRGLALEAVFMKNRAEVEKSIAVLAETLRHLYPALNQQP